MFGIVPIAVVVLLAWLGARAVGRLPHYEEQRRALPARLWIVSLSAGALSLLAVTTSSQPDAVWLVGLWVAALLLIALVDFETHYLPDQLLVPLIGLALLLSVTDPRLTVASALAGSLVGGLLLGLAVALSRGRLGWGDAKLGLFMGAVLGWPEIGSAIFVGTLLAALAAVGLLVTARATLETTLPYGTALAGGTLLTLLVL